MNNLYKQTILELYHNQDYRGILKNPTFLYTRSNPLCGDTVSISCIYSNGIVSEIRFTASGCVLSQAAATFVAKYGQGKTITALLVLDERFMQEQLSLTLGPTRLRCIMLPAECLREGLQQFNKQ